MPVVMGVKVAIFLVLSVVLGVMVFDLIMKIANLRYHKCDSERGPYPEALPTLARHIARILSRSFRRGQPHARRTS